LEVYRKLLSDTELEVGNKGGRRLEEGDRGGHNPRIGLRTIGKEDKDGEGHVLVIRGRNIVKVSVLEAGDTHSVTATGYKYVCFSLSTLRYSSQGELLPNLNNLHNPGNHFLALSTYTSSSTHYGEIRYSTNMALMLLFIPVT